MNTQSISGVMILIMKLDISYHSTIFHIFIFKKTKIKAKVQKIQNFDFLDHAKW